MGLDEAGPEAEGFGFVGVKEFDGAIGEPVVFKEPGREIEALAFDSAGVAAEFIAVFGRESVVEGLFVETVIEAVFARFVDKVHFADGAGSVPAFAEVMSNRWDIFRECVL